MKTHRWRDVRSTGGKLRERQLKGSRSRFGNPRALNTWSGQAGTGLLTYRWGTVQRFLKDLYQGLARTGG